MIVLCDYCNQPAELVGGDHIYPYRPDLASKSFWICQPCEAYVGTHIHSPSHKPLGRLAKADLRAAKMEAHRAFDPMWRECKHNRSDAYLWLADQLNMTSVECHIGSFDIATCQKVVDACSARE